MSIPLRSSIPNRRLVDRLPALDALRAIGATAVVGHHVGFATGATSNEQWGGWLARLDVGVAVFFVLSGFLLFRQWALALAISHCRPRTGRYLWRRALRILPAYWLAVVVCLLVLPQNQPAPAGDWLRHLSLTQIYDSGLLRHGLSQTWSLATEVSFYLLLPILASLALGRTWRPGRTAAIATASGVLVTAAWIAVMATGLLDMGLHTMWLPAYGGWFGAGMALAAAHVALHTASAPRAFRLLEVLGSTPLACWSLAVGLFAIATTPVAGPRNLTEPTPAEFAVKLTLYLAIGVLILVPAAFGPPTRTRALLNSAPGRWLGAVSYGLFLWHQLVLELIYLIDRRPLFTGEFASTFFLTMLGGLFCAAVSYYVLEQPLQMLGKRQPLHNPAAPIQKIPKGTVAAQQV
ncbi:MAG TPA: acyltransferase [Micromonosporaceae bacterium]|nr:acyltransferase [Micromonosporaceae bacterium]